MACLESQLATATKAMRSAFVKIIDLALAAIVHAGIVPVCTFDAYTLADVAAKKHAQL